MEKEKIYQLFIEIVNRLVSIYEKPHAKLNDYDKKIRKEVQFLFGLPEGQIPTEENLHDDLNIISDPKTLDDYESKLSEILTLAILSEKKDRELNIESKKLEIENKEKARHGASLKENELDLIDQKLKEIGGVELIQDSSKLQSLKWQRLSDEVKKGEELQTKKDKDRLMQIINELKIHYDRIYSKFPRNRNERDNVVVIKTAALFSLPVGQKPVISDFEYSVNSFLSNDEIKQFEEKLTYILKQAIQASQLDISITNANLGAKQAIKKIKNEKDQNKSDTENSGFFNKIGSLFNLASNKKNQNGNFKKLNDDRIKAEERIKNYEEIKKQELKSRHLAALAETEVNKLEKQIQDLDIYKPKDEKNSSKWERIKNEERKKLDRNLQEEKKKIEYHEKIKKQELDALHGAALAEMDLEKLNESGSVNNRILPYKWQRPEKMANYNNKLGIKLINIVGSDKKALSQNEVEHLESSLGSKFGSDKDSQKKDRLFKFKWERLEEEKEKRRKSSADGVIFQDKSREFLRDEDIDVINKIHNSQSST